MNRISACARSVPPARRPRSTTSAGRAPCLSLPVSLTSRDDRAEVRARLLERDVADLAALRRVPPEEVVRVRRVACANRILDIRIGSRLAELVVEDRARVLPAFGEHGDAVRALRVTRRPRSRSCRASCGSSRGSRRGRAPSRRRCRRSRLRRRARRRAGAAWQKTVDARSKPRDIERRDDADSIVSRYTRSATAQRRDPRGLECRGRVAVGEVLRDHVVQLRVAHRSRQRPVDLLDVVGLPRGRAAEVDVREREVLDRLAGIPLQIQARVRRKAGDASRAVAAPRFGAWIDRDIRELRRRVRGRRCMRPPSETGRSLVRR